ncbi:MAG: hypothetical protein U0835_03240 [Isosphaeraceae bacterium]
MPPVVPEAWKPRLRRYLRETRGEDRERLSAGDFPSDQSVIIRFPDGSHALFRYAFALEDVSAGEVAVFTEHCGYHVFPSGDAEVEVLRAAGPGPGPERLEPRGEGSFARSQTSRSRTAGGFGRAFARIKGQVSGHRSMRLAVDWLAAHAPRPPSGMVTQDEYSHDVLVPYPGGLWLAYDST